jgi:hypothetical protein
MVAGTLSKAEYFMGARLIVPRDANPKGFFEDWDINGINEELLASVVPKRPVIFGKERLRYRPLEGQRWLASLPLDTKIHCPADVAKKIETATLRQPYCFKDPRFCYTLPAWQPFLQNIRYVCVFRAPAITAASILKECRDAAYLHTLEMTFDQSVKVWTSMYEQVLKIHRHKGIWLFLHYNQLLSREGQSRLETFLDAPVDSSFPDVSLSRSLSIRSVPRKTWRVYQDLCKLAVYKSNVDQNRLQ